jgi:thiol-disulfide isomerase/thioredoxin
MVAVAAGVGEESLWAPPALLAAVDGVPHTPHTVGRRDSLTTVAALQYVVRRSIEPSSHTISFTTTRALFDTDLCPPPTPTPALHLRSRHRAHRPPHRARPVSWRYALDVCVPVPVLFISCKSPRYTGAHKIVAFNPSSLVTRLSSDQKGTTWLIHFGASWCDSCVYLEPTFAELSYMYSTDDVRFGNADVERWAELSTKYKVRCPAGARRGTTSCAFVSRKLTLVCLPRLSTDVKLFAREILLTNSWQL